MGHPKITNSLKGALGQTYYKEFCDQRGWAYLSVEDINNGSEDGYFTFKKGFHRIPVKIPSKFHKELELVSKPTNGSNENPSFVFDYLACRVGTYEKYYKVTNPRELCWIEIKTGNSKLSLNQKEILSKIQLPLAILHIENVLVSPYTIQIDYAMKSGKEWLEDL